MNKGLNLTSDSPNHLRDLPSDSEPEATSKPCSEISNSSKLLLLADAALSLFLNTLTVNLEEVIRFLKNQPKASAVENSNKINIPLQQPNQITLVPEGKNASRMVASILQTKSNVVVKGRASRSQ